MSSGARVECFELKEVPSVDLFKVDHVKPRVIFKTDTEYNYNVSYPLRTTVWMYSKLTDEVVSQFDDLKELVDTTLVGPNQVRIFRGVHRKGSYAPINVMEVDAGSSHSNFVVKFYTAFAAAMSLNLDQVNAMSNHFYVCLFQIVSGWANGVDSITMLADYPQIATAFERSETLAEFTDAMVKHVHETVKGYPDYYLRLPSAVANERFLYAARHGDEEVMRAIISSEQFDPSFEGGSVLNACAGRGYTVAVRLLLQDGRIDPGEFETIIDAIRGNDQEIISMMLRDPRVDPTIELRRHINLLAMAFVTNIETAKQLLDDGRIDPRAHNDYILNSLRETKQVDAEQLLMKYI